jgi:hypothetical protein
MSESRKNYHAKKFWANEESIKYIEELENLLKESITDKDILKYDNMKLYDENMKLLESITDSGVNIGKLESEKAELIECLQELYDDHDNYASIACDKAEITLKKHNPQS